MSTSAVVRRTLVVLTLGLMLVAPGLILAADGLVTPPKKPGKLHAVGNNSTLDIDMNWKDKSKDETGFRIERAQGSCPLTGWAPIGNQPLPANTTSYHEPMSDLSGLAKTTVSFRIFSFNTGGDSTKPSKCAVVTCSQCH